MHSLPHPQEGLQAAFCLISAPAWCSGNLTGLLFQKYAPTGTGTEVLALLVPSYMSKEAAEGRELCGVWMCPRDSEQSQQFLPMRRNMDRSKAGCALRQEQQVGRIGWVGR